MGIYNLKDLKYSKFDRVIIVMNGPGSSKLNWTKINREMEECCTCVIVTNGGLGVSDLIDHKNLIYLSNDPLIDRFLVKNVTSIDSKEAKIILADYPWISNDMLSGVEYDMKACIEFRKRKYTRIATRSEFELSEAVATSRIIGMRASLFESLISKVLYLWHQDGSEPSALTRRFGYRSWPTHSRIWWLVKKSNILKKLWYKLNFLQTPNSFYKALDLACTLSPREIFFVGRNSQLDEWLRTERRNNDGSLSVEYRYYFSDVVMPLKIKSYNVIMREMLYSSMYMHMMRDLFPQIRFFSLEKVSSYLDFYSEERKKDYIIECETNFK